jgi:ComF family protein
MLGAILQELWTKTKDGILPPQCLACGEIVAEPNGLCGACWQVLRFCDGQNEGPSGIWRQAKAAVFFEENSRRLIHGLKYYDRLELASFMARLMYRAGADLVKECDFILPVPLHRQRLWSRRFNQAALLSQKIAVLGAKTAPCNILLRARATGAQVGLSALARRGNIAGAFHVAESEAARIKASRILLVDDVMTTGSTAGEAVHCLMRAGAKSVDVLVFALVVEPYQSHIRHHGKN